MSSKLRVAFVGGLCTCLLAGCLPSLHPLYTEDVGVFREDLLGRWRWLFADHQSMEMHIESIDDKAYRITMPQGDEEDLVYTAHLIELGEHLYLEFQLEFDVNDVLQFNVLPSHQIMRIHFEGESLVTDCHDEPWLTEYLMLHPDELDHMFIEVGARERVVITAGTEELQQFFIAHGDEWEVASEAHWYRVDEDP